MNAPEHAALDQRYRASVYNDFDDRILYWTEFGDNWSEDFQPYYHWRRVPYTGTYINISDDGIRLTPKSEIEADADKVFMLGGSTLWGTGAIDAETIPAAFQELAGPKYDVTNYGETAYVSTQEMAYLQYLLAMGERPDVVIFYDGVNDGYTGTYSPAIPRDPNSIRAWHRQIGQEQEWSGLRWLYEKSIYPKFVSKAQEKLGMVPPTSDWEESIVPKIAENAEATVTFYEATIRQVRALGREYGFQSYFFWQPHLLNGTRTPFDSFEEGIVRLESSVLKESQKAVYDVAKARLSGRESEGIFFIGEVLDQAAEPIYIDWHHMSGNGNMIVARAMHELLVSKGFLSAQ